MIKHKITLHIAAMCAALLLPGAAVVQAATCSVPSIPYPTIQSAVSDLSCDTIDVAPGTYNESVTIGRALTLEGPNSGISALAARGAEATVTSPVTTFNLTNGGSVTIDGFTINGDFGVYVSGSSTGTVIENDIITGTTRALTFDALGGNGSIVNNNLMSNVRSLHVSSGPYTNLKVNGNSFSGIADTGIFFSGSTANTITGFEFKNNQVHHLANMASTITNGTVSGNTFDAPVDGFFDIQIDLHNSTVTGNTFEGTSNSGAGANNGCLQLFGSQFGEVPSDHVTVSGNAFNNCGSATEGTFAIQLSQAVNHITITGNAISNSYDGVNTRIGDGWDVTGLEIHINGNNITGSTDFGVNNTVPGVLDATCNWWGAANGPGPVGTGSGDKVSTGVNFTPWLNAPAPGGSCFPVAKTAAQCKNGGWTMTIRADGSSFKNQGDCMQYVNTGK